jgi:DNA-binding transcriptional MocR family regulator
LIQPSAERLRRLDAPSSPAAAYVPDQFLIKHGSQQLLLILAEAFFDPGDIVLLQDST